MAEENHSTGDYVDEIENGSRREYIDQLIKKVHDNHEWPSGTELPLERKRSLEQYIQLPDHDYGDLRSRVPPVGEILVTFYNHVIRRSCEPDDISEGDSNVRSRQDDSDDDSDDEDVEPKKARRSSTHGGEVGEENEIENEKSTCNPVPLQYLYDFSKDGTPQMLPYDDLMSHLPSGPIEGGGNLRVIEFPTPDYADDFLKATRDITLSDLADDPKAAMIKVKSNENSTFLRGVTYHPNVPPKQVVSLHRPRLTYPSGTSLFIAIPYLGQETLAAASFRKNPPLPSDNNYAEDGVAGRLTAYHTVDNAAEDKPSSNSSLNLLEYKFPSQSGKPAFKKWQEALEVEAGESSGLTVVHQAWFMVIDNETIVAFRSPDDRSGNLPLFPSQREAVGAYHGLANMIGNIVPQSEMKIPDIFSQRVSDLEFLAQTYDVGMSTQADSGDDLALRMKTTGFELSAIINVVDAQIDILERLAQFQLEENKEQFAIMRRTIKVTVRERMCFRGKIELVLSKLQDSQQRLTECLSKDTARKQTEAIGKQLEMMKEVVQASTRAADASERAAKESRAAVEASAEISEKIADVSEKTDQRAEDQGAKLSIFTLITTIFTPMNFLTSYWGMNFKDITNTEWKQPQFWELCAPFTIFILLIIYLWAFQHTVSRGFRSTRDNLRWMPFQEACQRTVSRGFRWARDKLRRTPPQETYRTSYSNPESDVKLCESKGSLHSTGSQRSPSNQVDMV